MSISSREIIPPGDVRRRAPHLCPLDNDRGKLISEANAHSSHAYDDSFVMIYKSSLSAYSTTHDSCVPFTSPDTLPCFILVQKKNTHTHAHRSPRHRYTVTNIFKYDYPTQVDIRRFACFSQTFSNLHRQQWAIDCKAKRTVHPLRRRSALTCRLRCSRWRPTMSRLRRSWRALPDWSHANGSVCGGEITVARVDRLSFSYPLA